MPAIRSITELAEKYKRVTPGRRTDYENGIAKPKADWASETQAAESAYAQGVQEAISAGRFGKGVSDKGTAGWQADTKQKGPERWATGIGYGSPKYATNFAPYADVIGRTVLPPKYAKGDPRNFDRVVTVATALHNAKVGK